MDAPGIYSGGSQKKHISKKEIEEMKKNMKKVPVISLKGDIYHEREEKEAEKELLSKINEENNK
jgi:hypothetical protein